MGGVRCRDGTAPVRPPNVIRVLAVGPLGTKPNDKGDNVLKLKSKLFAGASTLVVAGSMMAAAAPAAHAAVTNVGTCQGSVSLVKLSSPVKGVGLTDSTQRGIKATGALAKDQSLKTVVNGGGSCSGVYRAGDTHVPSGAVGSGNTVVSGLTAKAQATALLGNATCAQAPEVDPNANDAYPLNGKITWTFNQTYNDLATGLPKPFKMQADIALLGIAQHGDGADVVEVGGIVLSGVNAGAALATFATHGSFKSSIWEDPVAKTGGASGYNTGYELDLGPAVGCVDGTPNTANILQVLTGGGGASANSLLGDSANGLLFAFGEA
jgi:hypothetical protein